MQQWLATEAISGGPPVRLILPKGPCRTLFPVLQDCAGFTLTRPQSRQGVGHGHFVVNGMKCDVASRSLKPGDVIYVKPRVELQKLYHDITAGDSGFVAPFLSVDVAKLTIRVERPPMPEEFSLPVDVGRVVELLSR